MWSQENKARGQGHNKSTRPRTDPLEANAKDTGASVLKKKGLQKKFLGDLKKKVLKQFFRQKRSSK